MNGLVGHKSSARPNYNPTSGNLYANLTNSEDNTHQFILTFLSNGFKVLGTYAGVNAVVFTYIYAAFAEHPFATSRAR
jgi:hypothetical protein